MRLAKAQGAGKRIVKQVLGPFDFADDGAECDRCDCAANTGKAQMGCFLTKAELHPFLDAIHGIPEFPRRFVEDLVQCVLWVKLGWRCFADPLRLPDTDGAPS